jgi:hypothetical protein
VQFIKKWYNVFGLEFSLALLTKRNLIHGVQCEAALQGKQPERDAIQLFIK